jgi:arabinan endo-1,5-alpha-L-arabinosidase
MLEGGGRMVIHAGDRMTGAGHFGRTVVDEGVEVMSCHFEADYDRSGRSVLAIRPLLWRNDWPEAGDRFREGTYAIESERRGYALELRVDFVRQELPRAPHWNIDPAEPLQRLPEQTLDEVLPTWPREAIGVGIGDYMFRPHQKWTVTAVDGAGGYLGSPYYKVCIEGTDRALAATADHELTTVPAFTGAPEQLWRIEQCVDGTFRLMPQYIPGEEEVNRTYVLYSAGDSTPTLAPWDFQSDNAKWRMRREP